MRLSRERVGLALVAWLAWPAAAAAQGDPRWKLGFEPTAEGALAFLASLRATPVQELEIEFLAQELGSTRFHAREAAERKLLDHGIAATEALGRAALSEELEIRIRARRVLQEIHQRGYGALLENAFEVLARTKPRGAAGAILDAIPACTEDRLHPAAAAALMAVARPDDDGRLRVALQSPHAVTRTIVVMALAAREDESALGMLRSALADTDDVVRLAAARALANRGERAAAAVLVDLLSSDDVFVRSRSYVMLTELTHRTSRFVAWASEAERAPEVRAWQTWMATEGRTAALNFPLRGVTRFRPITGFLLSVQGIGVVQVDRQGTVKWSHACDPYDASRAEDGRTVITDRNKGIVSVINDLGHTVWVVQGLRSPTDAELLPNGNLLILENASGSVVEVSRSGENAFAVSGLETPFDVDRLANGNTLVADSGNNRLVEYDPRGRVVWQKTGLAFPNGVLRLADGSTIFTTYTSGTVTMLDAAGRERWTVKIPGSTLYAPDLAQDRVYVADSQGRQIVVLDLDGREVERIKLPETFVDVACLR